ncbi:aldo/keto reductase [Alloscardovia venturai]|uniref:Aldo/keto reductase n=1 Tax=Alloscardovia venturai TaxID=1769421 RepID=A0ABW2Y4J6_9BIFI
MDITPRYIADDNRYDGRMPYSRCGRSGLAMPQVSLGLWHNFGDNACFDTMRAICRTAFDAGITQFDIANNYGPEYGAAERNFGRVLKQDLKPYRDELLITTKAGYDMWPGPYGDGGSRKYLLASLDQSLSRLGLDYVDIFYSHRMDDDTPLEETMGALASAVQSGKALYAGISNYDYETTLRAVEILRELHVPIVINQVRYNIFDRHIELDGPRDSNDEKPLGLKDAAQKAGIGLITFSPLAQGLLTNRYLDGIPTDSRVGHDPRFLHEEDVKSRHEQIMQLNALAQDRGQSLAQMALSWILRDGIDGSISSVLIGASKPEQVLDCAQAVKNTHFSEDELAAIDAIAPVRELE